MLDQELILRMRRGLRRDGALILLASAVGAVPLAVWRPSSPALVVTVTAAMVGLAMYSRLAMGRWRTALQIALAGLLLAALGAPPRQILVVMVSGLAASELVARATARRMSFVKVGMGVAALAAVLVAAGAGDAGTAGPDQTGMTVLATALGAMLGPGLMLAFAPIAEWSLGHVTPMTLTEWLSYDHPLMRDLAVQAPGTFQHSVNVGLLADAAARDAGANPLLARIGGLYHDVGKLRAPGYFVENQAGHNPHDALDPLASARIVRGHVADGLALVREHHMGRVVADFVREHHGHNVMQLFYRKALERDAAARQDDFRYDGPSPSSRESAIVMIADQVEATARAAPPADGAACEAVVAQTIDRIVADGELARARLSARELEAIRASLARTISAMYHRRLTYPATPPAAPLGRPALVSRFFGGQRGRRAPL